VTVRIVGHAEARALNRRWRGHDYATNVLAFPAAAIPHISPPALGDIVLCAPVVVREALTQRKPPRAHWAHLLVHGVLHLLGDTHDRVASARRMQARERRILVRLGFSDPYREDVTV
jgi:probable rRNA maturation factor